MNKELLKRTIKNVTSWYVNNNEVLEDAENEQLLADIHELTNLLTTTTVTIEENYCPTTDKTFITEVTMADGDILAEKCIGWYFGEPDPEATTKYSRNGLKATFIL